MNQSTLIIETPTYVPWTSSALLRLDSLLHSPFLKSGFEKFGNSLIVAFYEWSTYLPSKLWIFLVPGKPHLAIAKVLFVVPFQAINVYGPIPFGRFFSNA
jgi:hypothetical protein